MASKPSGQARFWLFAYAARWNPARSKRSIASSHGMSLHTHAAISMEEEVAGSGSMSVGLGLVMIGGRARLFARRLIIKNGGLLATTLGGWEGPAREPCRVEAYCDGWMSCNDLQCVGGAGDQRAVAREH